MGNVMFYYPLSDIFLWLLMNSASLSSLIKVIYLTWYTLKFPVMTMGGSKLVFAAILLILENKG